ncbi:MAG: phage tail tape measure protein [Ketobacter sp.]|nr:phage tail tape measure protein [Ketobacter sp.]
MTLHELEVKVGTNTTQLDTLPRKVDTVMNKVQARMRKFGTMATASLTAPIALLGRQMLKTAGDFQSGMNMVQVLTGATAQQFDSLRDKAIELGTSSAFSAVQVTDAMRFMAMAGLEADEVYGGLEDTLNLAAAAGLSMGQAADIATNILTGFQLEVSDLKNATDILTTTFTKSNTDLIQLGEAFKFAGPIAKAAGISFEETAAILGMMGNVGIQASMAGTSLRGALTRLLSPTNEINAVLGKLGVVTTDSSGELLSMVQIVQQLEAAGAKAGDIMTIFGQRAGPAFAGIIGQGSQAMADFIDVLENDLVSTADVANATLLGFKGSMIELQSAFESFFIVIADNGLLKFMEKFVDGMTNAVRSMSAFSPAMLNAGLAIAGVLAIVGPLALAISFMGPITLSVVGGIAALAGALVLLKGESQGVSNFFTSTFGPAIDAVSSFFEALGNTIRPIWNAFIPQVVSAFSRLKETINTFVADSSVRFAKMMGLVERFWKRWGSLITEMGMKVLTNLVDVVTTSFGLILDTLNVVGNFLTGDFAGAWEGVKKIVGDAFAFMARIVLRGADTILAGLESITGFMPGFQDKISASRDTVLNLLDTFQRKPTEGIVAGMDEVVTGVDAATGAIGEMGEKTGAVVDSIIVGVGDIEDAFGDLRQTLAGNLSAQANVDDFFSTDPVEAARNQVDILTNALTEAFNQGASPGDAIVSDIANKLQAAQDVFGELATAAFKGVEATKPAEDIILDDVLDFGKPIPIKFEPTIEQENLERMQQFIGNMVTTVEDGMANAAESLGTGLAEMALQGASFGSVMQGLGVSIFTTLADIAIKTGKVAIGTGLAISGIKKALQTLNPVAAIGAGIALVALGSFVKASLSSIGSGGGGSVPSGGDGGVNAGIGAPADVGANNPVSFGLGGPADEREKFLQDLLRSNEEMFNRIADQFPDELVARVRGDDLFFTARRAEQRSSRTRGASTSGVNSGR